MHQVRAARAYHATAPPTAPPTAPAPAQLSREEREQLRVVRHHAFQRHQRNAAWMRELFQHQTHAGAAGDGPTSAAAQQNPNEAAEIEALRARLREQERQIEDEQKRDAELLSALRAIDSDEALAACQARVLENAARHASATRKEPRVIRL